MIGILNIIREIQAEKRAKNIHPPYASEVEILKRSPALREEVLNELSDLLESELITKVEGLNSYLYSE